MAHSADNLTGTDPCIQRFYPPYQAAGDSSKQWLIGPLPTLCDIEWWHFGATGLPQILALETWKDQVVERLENANQFGNKKSEAANYIRVSRTTGYGNFT
jgi:hypothetical protein